MAEKMAFSKAPLKEVIFEIRFPISMSVACKRDEFYNEIREDYPEIFLPAPSFELHAFDQPVQYLNNDKSERVTCSAQSLSFSTTRYESFEVFKKQCVALAKIFFEKYKTIDKIKRIGFRYINHIPADRKENIVDLSSYLNFKFSLPDCLSKHNLDQFQTIFFIELEKDTSTIRVAIDDIKDDKGKDVLMLDFDLISVREIGIKEIEKYLVTYHDKIEEVFLNITTDAYKKAIR